MAGIRQLDQDLLVHPDRGHRPRGLLAQIFLARVVATFLAYRRWVYWDLGVLRLAGCVLPVLGCLGYEWARLQRACLLVEDRDLVPEG